MAKARVGLDWDKVGAGASALCAVHCLITGVALGLLPVLGQQVFGDPKTDFVFLSVAALMGTAALIQGFLRHRQMWPSVFFVSGIVLVVISHTIFRHQHDGAELGDGDWIGTSMAVLGGLSLVTFHVCNLRLKAKCTCTYCLEKKTNQAP